MTIGVVADRGGLASSWDWKAEYVKRFESGNGYELFSQESITPDTMLILAGPPRLKDAGFTDVLHPLGLITDVSYQADNKLRPVWEIGTDRTFFTRGKTSHMMNIGAMLANTDSLMKALTKESYDKLEGETDDEYKPGSASNRSPGSGNIWTNLASQSTSVPFGILLMFKTKSHDGRNGPSAIDQVYLEHCHLSSMKTGLL